MVPTPRLVGSPRGCETAAQKNYQRKGQNAGHGVYHFDQIPADGEEVHTLEQIGSGMGVTRERIRQLKARALNKLRQPPQIHTLRALVA